VADPIRLLLVDDEVWNLKTFQRVYRKLYDITVASSGAEGLEMLQGREFDVVLSDYGMPGMTGGEFAATAKRTQPVAVVMVTGYIDHPDVVALEQAGEIFAVIGKPWEKESMISVIERARGCTRELRQSAG
jgi:CheY-like chemotaxis protein